MPHQIRAVVVDPAWADGKLAIKLVELRDPDRDEVGVRVTAISLNRGETRRALTQRAEPGWRPGWDFAGVVEAEAADGSGPKAGTRRRRHPAVRRFGPAGQLPQPCGRRVAHEASSDAQAATLPVAGLTALHALRQGGLLLGRKVLVDGASGRGRTPGLPARRLGRRAPGGARAAGGIPGRRHEGTAARRPCSVATSPPPARTGRSG